MDIKCLNCGGVLFRKNPLDNKGNWAIDAETPIELEDDESDSFFRCPHCSAKNVVVDSVSPTGLRALKIDRFKF